MISSPQSDSDEHQTQTEVRPARVEDLRAAAEVYLAAFPETLAALGAPDLRPEALEDLFVVCRQAEPEGFLVAEREGEIAGYVLCPSHTGSLWHTAVLRGHLLRMALRWLVGRYGLGLRATLMALEDKFHFWRGNRLEGAACQARILSLAVHPRHQGQGLGRKLMNAALAYLRSTGAPCVRLEVRPDNLPARRLYESLGFEGVGMVHDTRGPWLVMILRLREGSDD